MLGKISAISIVMVLSNTAVPVNAQMASGPMGNIQSLSLGGEYSYSSIPENNDTLLMLFTKFVGALQQKGIKCIGEPCLVFERTTDKLGGSKPLGWLESSLKSHDSVRYLFPIPERAIDPDDVYSFAYYIFTEGYKMIIEGFDGVADTVIYDGKSNTKCNGSTNSAIRQRGFGTIRVPAYSNSINASGFDFDIDTDSSINCSTSTGAPTIIPGHGSKPEEIKVFSSRIVVNCKNMTQQRFSQIGKEQPRAITSPAPGRADGIIVHGLWGSHFNAFCRHQLTNQNMTYPISAYNPKTGYLHNQKMKNFVTRTNEKFIY